MKKTDVTAQLQVRCRNPFSSKLLATRKANYVKLWRPGQYELPEIASSCRLVANDMPCISIRNVAASTFRWTGLPLSTGLRARQALGVEFWAPRYGGQRH